MGWSACRGAAAHQSSSSDEIVSNEVSSNGLTDTLNGVFLAPPGWIGPFKRGWVPAS